jgi:hypothetical protein
MGMFWIATAVLVLLIVLGMPIAFAIGIASIAFVLMASPPDLIMAPLRMYAGVNSFTLLALPFFILAAEIMIRAGVSTRLFAWVNGPPSGAMGRHESVWGSYPAPSPAPHTRSALPLHAAMPHAAPTLLMGRH